MENTPLKEIFQHFDIEDNPEQPKYFSVLLNNRATTRKQLELTYRLQGRKRVIIDYDPDYFCIAVSEIPFADICKMTAEESKEFADKVIYCTELDPDKREISIHIPQNSPKTSPEIFSPEQKEEAIIDHVRPYIRKLINGDNKRLKRVYKGGKVSYEPF